MVESVASQRQANGNALLEVRNLKMYFPGDLRNHLRQARLGREGRGRRQLYHRKG